MVSAGTRKHMLMGKLQESKEANPQLLQNPMPIPPTQPCIKKKKNRFKRKKSDSQDGLQKPNKKKSNGEDAIWMVQETLPLVTTGEIKNPSDSDPPQVPSSNALAQQESLSVPSVPVHYPQANQAVAMAPADGGLICNPKEDITELRPQNAPCTTKSQDYTCHFCHQRGHISRFCPLKNGKSAGETLYYDSGESGHGHSLTQCPLPLQDASPVMPLSSVKTFDGTNYDDWKESLDLFLAIAKLDLALISDAPSALTESSTDAEKAHHEKWHHSDRVCLMVMKYTINKNIRHEIPEETTAKKFVEAVGEIFKKLDTSEKSHYFSLLENTQYDGFGSVREHILKLVGFFNKLRSFNLDLGEDFLVWRILDSLPPQYEMLRSLYNAQETKWTVNQLIPIVTQEEESLKQQNTPAILNYVSHTSTTMSNQNGDMHMNSMYPRSNTERDPSNVQCNYCKKDGHMKADCFKLKMKNQYVHRGAQNRW